MKCPVVASSKPQIFLEIIEIKVKESRAPFRMVVPSSVGTGAAPKSQRDTATLSEEAFLGLGLLGKLQTRSEPLECQNEASGASQHLLLIFPASRASGYTKDTAMLASGK